MAFGSKEEKFSWFGEIKKGFAKERELREHQVNKVAARAEKKAEIHENASSTWGDYGNVTGYQQQEVDHAAMSLDGVAKANGLDTLGTKDVLAGAYNNNILSQDAGNNTNSVNTSFYGELDYGKDPKALSQIGLDLIDDVFVNASGGAKAEKSFYDPTGGIMGGSKGAFGGTSAMGGFGMAATSDVVADSRKFMGYDIYRDGMFDKVDMGGETFVLNIDGSLGAKCDLAGNPIAADNSAAANFYNFGSGSTDTASSIYGTTASADAGLGSFYGTGSAATETASFYGGGGATTDTASFYGTSGWGSGTTETAGASSFYGSTAQTNTSGFYGTSTAQADSSSFWGGGTATAQSDTSGFWGGGSKTETASFWGTGSAAAESNGFWGSSTNVADASSFYGQKQESASAAGWWSGVDSTTRAAEKQEKDNFYNSYYWNEDNKNNSGWG